MSGGIVFRNGGPLGWLSERQDRTFLSSCEAEIRATNATSKKVVDFRHLCTSLCEAGHSLPDATIPTLLYNDNDACVKWSHNMTSKAARHIKLRKNLVREWVQYKSPAQVCVRLAILFLTLLSQLSSTMITTPASNGHIT